MIYQKEMKEFWKDAEVKIERLLRDHRAEVEAVANALLLKEDLSGKELVQIIQTHSPSNGRRADEAEAVVEEAVSGDPVAEHTAEAEAPEEIAENGEGEEALTDASEEHAPALANLTARSGVRSEPCALFSR